MTEPFTIAHNSLCSIHNIITNITTHLLQPQCIFTDHTSVASVILTVNTKTKQDN